MQLHFLSPPSSRAAKRGETSRTRIVNVFLAGAVTADTRLTSMTDEFGNALHVSYDASSRPQRIADASGSGRFIDLRKSAQCSSDALEACAVHGVRGMQSPRAGSRRLC